MISKEFIEHSHGDIKYYEYQNVYFHREENLLDDDMFMKRMKSLAKAIHTRPIYIYRASTTGQLMCDYSFRLDCEYKKQIDDMKIMYREADIDFTNRNVIGFIEQCWLERKNHNVVCFLPDGFGNVRTRTDMTLHGLFKYYRT
jgi:hypothetical protein